MLVCYINQKIQKNKLNKLGKTTKMAQIVCKATKSIQIVSLYTFTTSSRNGQSVIGEALIKTTVIRWLACEYVVWNIFGLHV